LSVAVHGGRAEAATAAAAAAVNVDVDVSIEGRAYFQFMVLYADSDSGKAKLTQAIHVCVHMCGNAPTGGGDGRWGVAWELPRLPQILRLLLPLGAFGF